MASTLILSEERVRRTLSRLAYEILERNRGIDHLHVFGISPRGVALAEALVAQMGDIGEQALVVRELDITPYRDDRDRSASTGPRPRGDVDVTEDDVVLVDDVLFTGRTARAALDAIVDYGRPRSIQLAVLVDRGHREVPVHPDYVGRTIPTKHKERVVVDVDEAFAVYVEE